MIDFDTYLKNSTEQLVNAMRDLLIIYCVDNKVLVYCCEPNTSAYFVSWEGEDLQVDNPLPDPISYDLGYLVFRLFPMDDRDYNFEDKQYFDELREYYLREYPLAKERLNNNPLLKK